MNKQAKLFGFIAFILISFIGFGVYQVNATSGQTEVKIASIEGDSSQLSSVEMIGDVYSSGYFANNNTFYHADEEIAYLNDLPFFKRSDFEFNSTANRLIDNHRSFMRGKSRQSNLFAETEDFVVYTGMKQDVDWSQYNTNKATISVLDKETDEEQSFDITLDNPSAEGNFTSILSAYIAYPSLTIVASEYVADQDRNHLLVYTFNIENPAETLTPTINLTAELGASDTVISISSSITKTERYIPIKVMEQAMIDQYDMEVTGGTYHLYDSQTNNIIDIPAFEDEEMVVFVDEETVYVGRDLGETIELHEMDVTSQTLESIGSLDMATSTIGRSDGYYSTIQFNNYFQAFDGKLYLYEEDYSNEISRPLFQVIDLDSQDTLFSGTVEVKDTEAKNNYTIYINDYSINPMND